ncbi:alpha/beta fold hydrolase [Actinoplanes sp. LDG1-06]|uniref:Alpha/beta fold hydrolase n=1 Tax=Paractinoplanes ovalisporus TaxID=2810368 RepID=A0ABS2AA09_9ACTN|nr:alpha/beta fold hydrolase [Actinoplanes ovalisporus]MBM2616661.1 alpha/beta fold hydrolase [Actinoplanes ovalisporus]
MSGTLLNAGTTGALAGSDRFGPAHVFRWNPSSEPGTVLSSTPRALPEGLRLLARAKQIKYATTDVRGKEITASGLVLTPLKNKKNKTVVWAHGTTGIADKCAPSANDDVFWPEARVAVSSLLERGWTVAAPDYPGLGTPGPHPYLVGASEGRSIIDSVRAARNLDDDLSKQYAVDGHSQGGQGTLFANQLAGAYDGELQLKGTVSIAPTSQTRALAEAIPGSAGQGFMAMALYGLNAVEPSFEPETVLTPAARAKGEVLRDGCLAEVLEAYAPPLPLLKNNKLPEAWVDKLYQYVEPGRTPLTAPAFVVQGTDDAIVPAAFTDILVEDQLKGAPVRYDKLPGRDHDQAVIDSTNRVAAWISQRFDS